MASFTAAGTSYATHAEAMLPFYIFYSMFGFQRTMDQIWAFGDARGRGFLLGATAGRTTLNGEGLQHEDGHSHLLATAVPNIRAYDPAFAYETAVIVRHPDHRGERFHEGRPGSDLALAVAALRPDGHGWVRAERHARGATSSLRSGRGEHRHCVAQRARALRAVLATGRRQGDQGSGDRSEQAGAAFRVSDQVTLAHDPQASIGRSPQDWARDYETKRPLYEAYSERLHSLLRELCQAHGIELAHTD